MFNFFKTNKELNCRSAGLQFNNHLINNEWNNMGGHEKDSKPTFYQPYTACWQNRCLLLTGFSFKAEDTQEKREMVYVYDVLSGIEEYSLVYGYPTGKESEEDRESDNLSMEIHKKLTQEFKLGGKLKTLDNWNKYWGEYMKKYCSK